MLGPCENVVLQPDKALIHFFLSMPNTYQRRSLKDYLVTVCNYRRHYKRKLIHTNDLYNPPIIFQVTGSSLGHIIFNISYLSFSSFLLCFTYFYGYFSTYIRFIIIFIFFQKILSKLYNNSVSILNIIELYIYASILLFY